MRHSQAVHMLRGTLPADGTDRRPEHAAIRSLRTTDQLDARDPEAELIAAAVVALTGVAIGAVGAWLATRR